MDQRKDGKQYETEKGKDGSCQEENGSDEGTEKERTKTNSKCGSEATKAGRIFNLYREVLVCPDRRNKMP